MKKLVWLAVIVLILVLGYLGRHRIKAMLGMSTPAPTATSVTTATPEASVTASPSASNITMIKTDPKKGDYLTDAKGMTLYIFDKDTKGMSSCNGICATTWPPYLVGSNGPTIMPDNITTIKRSDGSMQYAYKGMPLYYYAKDTKVGYIMGDGVSGVWHLVKP